MRYISRAYLLLILTGFCSCQIGNHSEQLNTLPKTEILVDQLPDKSKVWVFVMAGQSNMAGRGVISPADTTSHSRIFALNAEHKVILAKEPLHYYEPEYVGLDCGLSFGREIIKHLPQDISILLVPCAVGGSSIQQWLDDEVHRNVKLKSNLRLAINKADSLGIIKGLLWHQGESDALHPLSLELYDSRLSNFMKEIRYMTKTHDLPILIGELGSFSENHKEWKKINQIIYKYVSSDSFSKVVPLADLNHLGDRVHFDAASTRLMGKRYALAYLDMKSDVLPKR